MLPSYFQEKQKSGFNGPLGGDGNRCPGLMVRTDMLGEEKRSCKEQRPASPRVEPYAELKMFSPRNVFSSISGSLLKKRQPPHCLRGGLFILKTMVFCFSSPQIYTESH